MPGTPRNSIEFKVWGRYALFTDPLSRLGGEKCTYHIPTYEALKGIVKSIYWKPSLIWQIDQVRVMRRIRTQTKATKPLVYSSGKNDLAIYTYLADVEYQVRAHFVFNMFRPELAADRVDGKHFQIAQRMLEKGGRQDVFLGTRECQGYVEPCEFGSGQGFYDDAGEITYGLMFHGFDYPDEIGRPELKARFWRPTLRNGIICFPAPEACEVNRFVREMHPKVFETDRNMSLVEREVERGL